MSAPAGWFAAIRSRTTLPNGRPGAPSHPLAAEVLLDERTMARLRQLSLVAGRARAEGLAGEHRSRRRGTSPEFADFKRYSQGDDFRRIDWNTYARLDGLFVRLSEVTTELSVHILLDSSASMDWRGTEGRPTKFTAARRLAGALAYIALWGFDRVTIVPFADATGRAFGPAQGRTQVVPAMRFLQRQEILGGTALAPVIAAYASARSRPGLLLVISDLLSGEPEDLRVALHDLRARGWQSAVLHVVDEAEIDPAAANRWLCGDDGATASIELIDSEAGDSLRFAPDEDLIARYAAAVGGWLNTLEDVCASEATSYARLPTSWEIDDLTIGLLHARGVVE
jgi:uncharacterized protein (DUF58 family)